MPVGRRAGRLTQAAYRTARPISVDANYGYIDQFYLYGESRPGNPNEIHKGVDFPAPRNRSVYAIADGVVVNHREDIDNGTNPYPWGNFVLVRHNQQHYDRISGQNAYVYSLYMHLRKDGVLVNDNDPVAADQNIAEVDSTGNSSGDHLHLQIMIHNQPDRTLWPNNTLDSENRSRNPELWLTPYNGNTGTVVGKVTNVNGDPVGGLLVYGLQKQAGWGYGSSQTYNNTALKPDDILVENWSTTDVTPGTYTITLSNGSNMGRHTVQAGQITYVGLYPVWLPYIKGGYNDWNSTITVRNNSSAFRAQVNTTFFNSDGSVRHQRTDYINAKAIAALAVPSNLAMPYPTLAWGGHAQQVTIVMYPPPLIFVIHLYCTEHHSLIAGGEHE